MPKTTALSSGELHERLLEDGIDERKTSVVVTTAPGAGGAVTVTWLAITTVVAIAALALGGVAFEKADDNKQQAAVTSEAVQETQASMLVHKMAAPATHVMSHAVCTGNAWSGCSDTVGTFTNLLNANMTSPESMLHAVISGAAAVGPNTVPFVHDYVTGNTQYNSMSNVPFTDSQWEYLTNTSRCFYKFQPATPQHGGLCLKLLINQAENTTTIALVQQSLGRVAIRAGSDRERRWCQTRGCGAGVRDGTAGAIMGAGLGIAACAAAEPCGLIAAGVIGVTAAAAGGYGGCCSEGGCGCN